MHKIVILLQSMHNIKDGKIFFHFDDYLSTSCMRISVLIKDGFFFNQEHI